MSHPAPTHNPCQGRAALAEWDARTADSEAAERIHAEVLGGLAGVTDTFTDAMAGDFPAETDERILRDKYRKQPATLASRLAANRRALRAQLALHVLYNKLIDGAAMSLEETALAEHARDLANGYAAREAERRCRRTLP